ncbi:MAG: hypothetical protein K2I62_08500, partial [Alistipes sp.]|nr:hypothetical protein [Alistipes sp.]
YCNAAVPTGRARMLHGLSYNLLGTLKNRIFMKFTKFVLLAATCLFCGCKDDEIEIPKTLSGTVWTAQAVENQAANYTLAFQETECTLEKSIAAQ